MIKQFESWHPLAQFVYFALVFGISVCVMHPVITGITFACAIVLGIVIDRRKFLKMFFCLYMPAIALGIIINPLFSHEGVTILWYFPDRNPLTLESIIFGIMSGIMIGSIFTLLFSFNKVMTSDRIMYLIGGVLPHISLIIAMALRFIPEFKHHLSEVLATQKCIGKGIGEKNIFNKIKNACAIMSIMVTWAFESSVERSDSMRARGYGLQRRSRYVPFKLAKRDIILIAFMVIAGGVVICSLCAGYIYVRYYPYFKINEGRQYACIIYILYAVLCMLPVLDIECAGIRNRIQSGMIKEVQYGSIFNQKSDI